MFRKLLYLSAFFLLALASCTQKSPPPQDESAQSSQITNQNAFITSSNTSSEISFLAGKMVYYGSGTDLQASNIQLRGYALPTQQAGSTAIVAVPGRLGLSEAFKKSLSTFSQHGFSVLAVDLFNQVPDSLAAGKALETALEQKGLPDIIANISQAQKFIAKEAQPSQIVLIGWDTGGKWAATTALSMPGIFAGVVSYTGNLSVVQEYTPQSILTPIFGVFAVGDTDVSAATMATLFTNHQQQRAPVTFKLLQNVQGNFMDPASTTYQGAAAATVLQATLTFISGLNGAVQAQPAGDGSQTKTNSNSGIPL